MMNSFSNNQLTGSSGPATSSREPRQAKQNMNCTIYRSSARDYTYVYLREDLMFEELPESLRSVFGEPEKVMELELAPDRELAQEDVAQVLANLEGQGFHLQMPPSDDPSGWLDLPSK